MLANLSFRTKLLSLLITAILGFIIVIVMAMQSLASQQDENAKLRVLSKIQNTSNTLSIHMSEIADNLRDLTNEQYKTYLSQLNAQISQNTQIINTNIARASSDDLKTILKDTQGLIDRYSDVLITLVKARHTIGFDANSGLHGKINTLGQQLSEDIKSLSLLKREFTNVRKAEASYLFGPTKDNLAEFKSSFERLNLRIENFGFEDTHGKVANAYYASVMDYGKQYAALTTLEKSFTKKKAAFDTRQMDANQLIEKMVSDAEIAAVSNTQKANITLLIVSVIVTLIAAALMSAISRNVNNTLKRIIHDLNKVKAGDMTAKAQVNQRRNDEFDLLSRSLNDMTNGLDKVLKDVVSTASNVSNMSADVDGAINNLANSNSAINQRTLSLAKGTDEISNRINQLSDTTNTLRGHSNDTYESAKTGSQTIRLVIDNLKETVSVVDSTGDQLNQLGRLSSDIDNVIGMINDLASQTNLLALNAAIEAARAGEAGRGFSVVADEVRSLAEKTVDATSKITEIVSTIQTSTSGAITTMERGQQSLKVIADNGEQAQQAIHTIENNALVSSQSADTMASAIQEVATTAVQMSTEMDEIAQQLNDDTGSIKILADKTKQIKGLAEQLSSKTQVFTLT